MSESQLFSPYETIASASYPIGETYDLWSNYGMGLDNLWHITLPVLSLVIAGFATLTMLTKNSFIDEINK